MSNSFLAECLAVIEEMSAELAADPAHDVGLLDRAELVRREISQVLATHHPEAPR